MKMTTKWIVSDPPEAGGNSPYSGYSDAEITEMFKHFNPDKKILFASEDRNEARDFYDNYFLGGPEISA